jgi:hypothetical protein
MLAKIIIIVFMLTILGSLGSALYFLIHDTGDSKRTAKALTWRISLSITLFILLILGFYLGILHPHPL